MSSTRGGWRMGVVALAVGVMAVLTGCLSATPGGDQVIQGHSENLEKAVAYLQTEARSEAPERRAQAIESLQPLKDGRVTAVVEQGLRDPAAMVRFAAAMAAGKRHDVALKPALQELVAKETNGSARVAMIFALEGMGDSTNMSQLPGLLAAPEAYTRADAALALGLMGEKSAIPMLLSRTKDPDVRVRFEITAALARLGDAKAQDVVLGMSVSQYGEDRYMAMAVCPDMHRPEVANVLVAGLTDKDPHDGVIAGRENMIAARALCRIGDVDNYRAGKLALQYAYHRPEPEIRALAILALGEALLPDEEKSVAYFMYQEGEDPRVHLASAAAVVNVWARASK